MERLAKLKAKLFQFSKLSSKKTVATHHNSSSQTMATAEDTDSSNCQGHFYWSDARRIYSDPAPRRASKQQLESEGRGDEDWTGSSIYNNVDEEDDVFYDNYYSGMHRWR